MARMAGPAETKIAENPLFVSWVDSAWIPVLNQNNVLDYFSEKTNPFYDRTCNNEILKMQKLGVADVQLTNMQVCGAPALGYPGPRGQSDIKIRAMHILPPHDPSK